MLTKQKGKLLSPCFKIALFLSLIIVLVIPASAQYPPNFTPVFSSVKDNVHYNITSDLDPGTTTPRFLWIMGGLTGLILFLYSLKPSQSVMELERDAIVSVVAWIPITYCAYSSWAIDLLDSYGATGNGTGEFVLMIHHTIYQYPTIGILMYVFLGVAVLNTLRIVGQHKLLKGQQPEK